MGRHRRVVGRHRAPSTASQTAARVATVSAVAAAPLAIPLPAEAVGMPANVRDAIIQCESENRNVEHGGDPGGISTASGYYQFVNGTWRAFGGTEFAPRAIGATKAEQTIVADRAFAANGLQDWEASRSCWASRIGSGKHASGRKAPIASSAIPRHAKSEGTYIVKPGDTLRKIAAAHGTTWQKLYAANRGVIASPALIHPGMTLDV